MIGTVQSVSDFPVTAERFNSIISNQSLFQDLIGQSSKLEMRTALQADTQHPERLQMVLVDRPALQGVERDAGQCQRRGRAETADQQGAAVRPQDPGAS